MGPGVGSAALSWVRRARAVATAHPTTVDGLFAGALLAAALLSIRVQVQTYQDSDPGCTLESVAPEARV